MSPCGQSRVSAGQGEQGVLGLPGLGPGSGSSPTTPHSPTTHLLPVAKEIQLMHRAPVVGILVLDGHSVPLPEPLEVAHDLSKSPDMQGSHQLLVVSEEQFKVPHGQRRVSLGLPGTSRRLGPWAQTMAGTHLVCIGI